MQCEVSWWEEHTWSWGGGGGGGCRGLWVEDGEDWGGRFSCGLTHDMLVLVWNSMRGTRGRGESGGVGRYTGIQTGTGRTEERLR